MHLAPGAILVNASGCFLDWLITRAWGRISLLALPGLIAVTLFMMSTWGSLLPKQPLAGWYLSIGEKELKKIGDDWAFGGTGEKTEINLDELDAEAAAAAAEPKSDDKGKRTPGGKTSPARDSKKSSETQKSAAPKAAEPKKEVKISRFTEAVFRRAQQLQSDNPEIMFVIAAMMSQQGSLTAGINLLKEIAPDNKEGHSRSHALIAYNMLRLGNITTEQLPVLRHHLDQSTKFSTTPPQLLMLAAQFAFQEKNFLRAIDLLKRAATLQPEYYLQVLEAAQASDSKAEADNAARRAKIYFGDLISKGEDTPRDRLMLAQVHISYKSSTNDDLVTATQLLDQGLSRPGLKPEEIKSLSRGLSDVLRVRFKRSLEIITGDQPTWQANIELLDQAMRVDPTNPGISEEIAILVRIGGDKPPEHLINQLKEVLAEGTATPLTHAMLSEAYYLQENYDKSIDHCRKLLASQPGNPQYNNNLAYTLAMHKPNEIEKAREHAELAVRIAPFIPDFRDTLGYVYIQQKRYSEAITQLEFAIELAGRGSKLCPEYHQRIAEAYKLEGNAEQAEVHLKIADQQQKKKDADAAQKKKEEADKQIKPADQTKAKTTEQPIDSK